METTPEQPPVSSSLCLVAIANLSQRLRVRWTLRSPNGWFARRGRATNAKLGEAVRVRAVVTVCCSRSRQTDPRRVPDHTPATPTYSPATHGSGRSPGPWALRANRVRRQRFGAAYLGEARRESASNARITPLRFLALSIQLGSRLAREAFALGLLSRRSALMNARSQSRWSWLYAQRS